MVLTGSLFFLSSPRTNIDLFFSTVGTLTLTPTGTRALEQARGIREVTFVVLSPLDRLRIVGDPPFSTGL